MGKHDKPKFPTMKMPSAPKGLNIKSISKGIGKATENVSSGVGSAIGNVSDPIIRGLGKTVDIGTDAINSPIMYIGIAIVGVVILTTVMAGSSTANKALENPESMRILAQSLR
jgi:hypothetical protein